jgi:hypothetical protein
METLRDRLQDLLQDKAEAWGRKGTEEEDDFDGPLELTELGHVLYEYISAVRALPAADPRHLEHELLAEDLKPLFKHLMRMNWTEYERKNCY